jgi:neurotransmitter:Na+ symporter, NSS family
MTDVALTKKDFFSSRLGFIMSTAGSAIGLANIWKFPYIVGKCGGGGFILIYLLLLLLVGFPAFLSEILVGKTTRQTPAQGFKELGGTKKWGIAGSFTVWTGFFVSSFYSVVAGWILGYFFESISGNLQGLNTITLAQNHYSSLMQDPLWALIFHAIFALICLSFLVGGIKSGIERCNKIFMPLFFVILIAMTAFCTTLPAASDVVGFMTTVDFKALPASCFILALGHAFFTLSVGQGTMATYGSYLKQGNRVLSSSLFILLADTLVSLFAAFCILSIVFSAKMEIEFGPGLIFSTLPTIFSQIPFGKAISAVFFFLVFIAALTSQVSALEPLISHLGSKYKIARKGATLLVCGLSFLIGIPSALSTNILKNLTFFNLNFLESMNFATTSILVPLGALAAVVLIGWKKSAGTAFKEFKAEENSAKYNWFFHYLRFSMRYSAPVLIIYIFLNAIGVV